jgi:polysaccharide biosynthesis/export protein
VQVYGRPELQTTNYIAEDGTVAVPLVGNVPVAGLSATNAAQRIAAAFKKGQFLKNPQVTVLVTQSRSQMVSVLGEVRAPGRFAVDASTNVLDLLAQAGGTTDRSGNTMYIIRTSDSGEVDRRPIDLRGLHSDRYALKLLTLRGGDSVYVPPADQFYIYGEVHEPNMYRLEPEMTVLQAISRGGGLTKVASSGRVEIKRRGENGDLVTRKVALTERVQPDDVIYVKESLF